MNIEIRRASESEASHVSEILGEAVAWLQRRGVPMWTLDDVSVRRVEDDVNAGNFFLAWSGKVAVGTIIPIATNWDLNLRLSHSRVNANIRNFDRDNTSLDINANWRF